MRNRILLVTLAASLALLGAGAALVAHAGTSAHEAGWTWGNDRAA